MSVGGVAFGLARGASFNEIDRVVIEMREQSSLATMRDL